MVDWSEVKVREISPPRRKAEPFAILPLTWAAKAAAATNTVKAMVWLWLAHETRKTGSNTVVVSNEVLAEYGIGRKVKYRALIQLEKAGVITIKRRGRNAPIVRLLR
jgi:hypothetical protein